MGGFSMLITESVKSAAKGFSYGNIIYWLVLLLALIKVSTLVYNFVDDYQFGVFHSYENWVSYQGRIYFVPAVNAVLAAMMLVGMLMRTSMGWFLSILSATFTVLLSVAFSAGWISIVLINLTLFVVEYATLVVLCLPKVRELFNINTFKTIISLLASVGLCTALLLYLFN